MELLVSLNGVKVGILVKDKSGGLHFSYTEQWMKRTGARPISLSLPITKQKYAGDLVYNFFDNLLPDNPNIRNKIQARFNVGSGHAFDLLAAIGKDCVGAIQLSSEQPESVNKLNYKMLSAQDVEKLLQGYKHTALGMEGDDDDFRISIAGAQEKTALLKIGQQWAKPIGATPTSHIMKLPMGELPQVGIDLTDSCENEFICLELARAFGFNVANSEVLYFGDQKVLGVERFDRKYASDGSWLMRLPQEDFCQAMGISSAQKYQSDGGPGITNCLNLLTASSNQKDRATFFKTQIFFWLIAAIDGHGKNFSVFLEPENTYRMTPLYDVLSAFPVMLKSASKKALQPQKIKMAMSLKGKNTHWKWSDIQPRHFVSTAEYVKYPVDNAKSHYEYFVDNVENAIAQVEGKIPNNFPLYVPEAIFSGLRKQAAKKLL
ncbi:type II toxin-antitoxin system HipA family toxin [Paraglaciecola chathamensis]|uniref:type II toxin-antitoxin system HipA family toxin n=1 Tax=Paraglaciecola chathamensis TaxID=368405 RepID=UPI0027117DB9|nr:type II toxin-antitoxin system HipA family toxin [Paraglaciecola chathamensis]MDO6840779.1 type II toxin-antitoxin system HipA family toxin [Paraglaciecola chathamensis]